MTGGRPDRGDGLVTPVVRSRRRGHTRARRVTRWFAVGVPIVCLTVVAMFLMSRPDSATLDASAATTAPTTTPPTTTPTTTTPTTTTAPAPGADTTLPPNSGSGRRVVFSGDRQRIWWVDSDEAVLRTALASGRQGVPKPGTYAVYSKSEHATGIDGSKMQFFVRFAKGPAGWAVGFHNIPQVDGEPAQTVEQLGQKLSHGCIRQAEEDARFMWDFLAVGDPVVVTD